MPSAMRFSVKPHSSETTFAAGASRWNGPRSSVRSTGPDDGAVLAPVSSAGSSVVPQAARITAVRAAAAEVKRHGDGR